jgi:hypothetical protein
LKSSMVAFVLRVKVLIYTTLFKTQLFLVRIVRLLPGCWKRLGIPEREIPSVETWIRDSLEHGKCYGANSRSPKFISFGIPISISRRHAAPPGLGGVHPELRKNCLEFRPPYLAVIPSARLLGPHGSVITPDGGIVKESSWSSGLFQQDQIYRSLRLSKPRELSGSFYTIATSNSTNYYHWVIEILPRLFGYESFSGDCPRLIVNSPLNKWQTESLALFGFQGERVYALGGEYLHVENLYFPSLVGINPITLRWLRENAPISKTVSLPSKRIYISRRLARKRRLINETEIVPFLHELGFIVADLETLSFADQVTLFSQAEVIVGIHGAGLANMVFAPEGCKVMELVDPMYVGAMFYMLAETLSHLYWFCVGQSVGDDPNPHGGVHGHSHITVSVDLFKSKMNEMLAACT